ncbi:hypothetical protein DFJ73DRAFT_794056 [Zopfochytrium polystomum]|nr:hypothetical protein DFJ73DRAFT_794056 [Zopfochytrium polystomum]
MINTMASPPTADQFSGAASRRLASLPQVAILRYLPRRDVAAVARVSAEWAAAARPLLYKALRLCWPEAPPAAFTRRTANGGGDDGLHNDDDPEVKHYRQVLAYFFSRERHLGGFYEPLPDEIAILAARDPSDPWNPLPHVRKLDIAYAQPNEEGLLAILSALAAAGTRLDALTIDRLTLSEEIIAALRSLLQDASSLNLVRIEVPLSLADPFAQLFPRLRSLAVGELRGIDKLAPKLVSLNTNTLVTYVGTPYHLPFASAMIPVLADVTSLRHLSLQLAPGDDAAFAVILRRRGNGLRSLRLGLHLQPESDLLRQILATAPNLVALDLYNGVPSPVSLGDLSHLSAATVPCITRLRVEGVPPALAGPLIALLKPWLELLILPRSFGPDRTQAIAMMTAVGPLPSLRRLALFDALDPPAVAALAAACPRLQHLEIPATPTATGAPAAIDALACIPDLRSVVVTDLPSLQDPAPAVRDAASLVEEHPGVKEVVFVWFGGQLWNYRPFARLAQSVEMETEGRVRFPRRRRDWPALLHTIVQFDPSDA